MSPAHPGSALSPRGIIVVFARQPQPGRVKTRLIPEFTPRQAADFYAAMLADVLAATAQFATELGLEPWLAVTPGRACAELARHAPTCFRVIPQRGAGLAERMAWASAQAGATGARNILLRGSDSPMLDGALVASALASLDENDVVLSPDPGGGFRAGKAAMDHGHRDSLPGSGPQTLGFGKETFRTVDTGKDQEELFSRLQSGAEVGRNLGPVIQGESLGRHRGRGPGPFAEGAGFERPVPGPGESPGNRGGGHRQDMGAVGLDQECGLLPNPKSVLLVEDHESEILEGNFRRKESVSADDDVGPPRFNFVQSGFSFGCRVVSEKPRHSDSGAL